MLLSIGIDAYPTAPLSFCVNDAREIAAVLEESEFGFITTQLFNEQATRRGIQYELDSVLNSAPDLFVLYFAGHGCSTDLGSYLVTYDAELYDEGFEVKTLARWIDRFAEAGAGVVIILDCCHSGAATVWPDRVRLLSPLDVEQGLGPSRVVLAACRPQQWTIEEGDKQHGLFTHHLLNGVMGEASDRSGRITVTSLYEYMTERLHPSLNPMPVFRAMLTENVTLGCGFPPIASATTPEADLLELEKTAREHLDGYDTLPTYSLEEKALRGYRTQCQVIEPVVRWFDSTLQSHPMLKTRASFLRLVQASNSRVAQLGYVDAGTFLREGKLLASLGEGSFGRVWKVETVAGSFLAYKIYHPQDIYNDDKLNRFERGYRSMRQLEHPNIVTAHNYTKCPLGFFMDFIDGPNLRELSPTAIQEPLDRVTILNTVAHTILYAHGKGVIHRDIKPENIVLAYDSNKGEWIPNLTDFDLAWFATATKLTKEAFGTIHYAAPEQLNAPKSNAAHAEAVDIFAFGQLIFFFICGRDPSIKGHEENLPIIKGTVRSWPSAKAAMAIVSIYEACTAYTPEYRVKTFGEIVRRLHGVMDTLSAVSESEELSARELLHEIAFALGTWDSTQSGELYASTVTISGRTRVNIEAAREEEDRITIKAIIRPEITLMAGGAGNFEAARRALNRRRSVAMARDALLGAAVAALEAG